MKAHLRKVGNPIGSIIPAAMALPSSVKEVMIIPLGRGRLVLPREGL